MGFTKLNAGCGHRLPFLEAYLSLIKGEVRADHARRDDTLSHDLEYNYRMPRTERVVTPGVCDGIPDTPEKIGEAQKI